jgi:DNA-binding CsgD family transcriptional regulator
MMAEPIRDDVAHLDFESRLAARGATVVGETEASMTPVVVCPSCHAPLDLDGLLDRLVALRSSVERGTREAEITPREGAVLDALLQGYRTHQIAMRLKISSHTVRKHLRNLYAKAGCASQADLVAWARSRPTHP